MHAVLNFHCNLGIVFSLELQNSAELAVQAGHCSRVRIMARAGAGGEAAAAGHLEGTLAADDVDGGATHTGGRTRCFIVDGYGESAASHA